MSVTVFHGTTATRQASILTDGLRPVAGVGPFVTADEQRARGYAVRAVCAELCERGRPDARTDLPASLVVRLRVDPASLAADATDTTDHLLGGGCDPVAVVGTYTFDPLPYMPDEAGVRGYGGRVQMARSLDQIRSREWLHGIARSAVAGSA
jgi:hypothetical protein